MRSRAVRRQVGVGSLVAAAVLLVACSGGDGAEQGAELRHEQRLAVQTSTGEIDVFTRDGGLQRVSPPTSNGEATAYSWPTWSPDGTRLALITTALRSNEQWVTIVAADGVSTEPRASEEEGDLIYLSWAPDSATLGALSAGERSGVELRFLDGSTAEPRPARALRGSTFYFAWSADSERLLYRSGTGQTGEVGIFSLVDGSFSHQRPDGAAAFRAPSWSSLDGLPLVGLRDGDGMQRLSYLLEEGEELVAALEGAPVFAHAHNGSAIAYVQLTPGSGLFRNLMLAERETGETRLLVEGPVVAFFWSPDDSRIAFVTLSEERTTFQWKVVDVRTGRVRPLDAFKPSSFESFFLSFFDQYIQSTEIWSADSSTIVMAGTVFFGGQPVDEPGIYLIDAGGGQAERLADGVLAFWEPVRP